MGMGAKVGPEPEHEHEHHSQSRSRTFEPIPYLAQLLLSRLGGLSAGRVGLRSWVVEERVDGLGEGSVVRDRHRGRTQSAATIGLHGTRRSGDCDSVRTRT